MEATDEFGDDFDLDPEVLEQLSDIEHQQDDSYLRENARAVATTAPTRGDTATALPVQTPLRTSRRSALGATSDARASAQSGHDVVVGGSSISNTNDAESSARLHPLFDGSSVIGSTPHEEARIASRINHNDAHDDIDSVIGSSPLTSHQNSRGEASTFSARASAAAADTTLATTTDGLDDSLWDDDALQQVEELEAAAHKGAPLPIREETLGGSSATRTRRGPAPSHGSSGRGDGLVQRTLFGGITSTPQQQPGAVVLASTSAHDIVSPTQFTQIATGGTAANKHRTKQWDRTAYAKSGPTWKRRKAAVAAKRERDAVGRDEDDVEDVEMDWDGEGEYEHFVEPEPQSLDPLRPMKLRIDEEMAKTWIYPTNKELRDYQFNIVQKALFNNVLVALPTGLGKTFIAAVVILNYFRWYPQGKTQQQQACHGICGLPWDTAVEMTGSTKASLRGDEWNSKRIFYMTPQCFENDLCSTSVDAMDVICVVVDEAHRATGNYAYGNVIQYLMQRNPNFRVLALTATPGNNPEKVQEVVDNLHISVIEIRTEEALDIRKYMHRKHELPVVVPMEGDAADIKGMWASMMRTYQEPLEKAGLLRPQDPALLHPFAIQQLTKDQRHRHILNKNGGLYSKISELASMSRAMQYLVEHSLGMFRSRVQEYEVPMSGTSGGARGGRGEARGGRSAGASSKRSQFFSRSNPTFRRMMEKLEALQARSGGLVHPKMEYMRDAIVRHLDEEERGSRDTRVMVFCSYRECVTEIVAYLNAQGGNADTRVRATQFIGQSVDKKGNKGFTQKDQEKVIQQFKRGDFNVIVATSIGEEGLDIGEVDLIVCYEAVKDSVRMLQRIGRTGRKRDGKILVLMSEGRESGHWRQSKDAYRAVQKDITQGLHVELFDDVPRLVPDHLHPRAVKKEVEQPEFDPEMIGRNRRKARTSSGGPKKQTKAKRGRDSDPTRNAPPGALMRFFKASELRHSRGRNDMREVDDESSSTCDPDASGLGGTSGRVGGGGMDGLSDDSDDEELSRGLDLAGLRRESPEVSTSRTSLARSARAGNLSGARAVSAALLPAESSGGSSMVDKGKGRALSGRSSGSTSTPAGSDSASSMQTSSAARKRSRLGVRRSLARRSDAEAQALPTQPRPPRQETFAVGDDDIIDLLADSPLPSRRTQRATSSSTRAFPFASARPALEASDADAAPSRPPDKATPDLESPLGPSHRPAAHPLMARLAAETVSDEVEAALGLASGEEEEHDTAQQLAACEASAPGTKLASHPSLGPGNSSHDATQDSPVVQARARRRKPAVVVPSSSPRADAERMPPPRAPRANGARPASGTNQRSLALAQRRKAMPPSDDCTESEPAQTRRRGLRNRKRRRSGSDSQDGDSVGGDAEAAKDSRSAAHGQDTAAGRGGAPMSRAGRAESKINGDARQKKQKKKITGSPTSRHLFQYEADLTSDEERGADEDDEGIDTDEADSSDREHVGHFEPTQAPRGYDQRSIYARSLLTQGAPTQFQSRRPFRQRRDVVSIPVVRPGSEATPARHRGGASGRGGGARTHAGRGQISGSGGDGQADAAGVAWSSPTARSWEQDDDYERDSFIASDNEDVEQEHSDEDEEDEEE